jgi:hypothetical protein
MVALIDMAMLFTGHNNDEAGEMWHRLQLSSAPKALGAKPRLLAATERAGGEAPAAGGIIIVEPREEPCHVDQGDHLVCRHPQTQIRPSCQLPQLRQGLCGASWRLAGPAGATAMAAIICRVIAELSVFLT